MDSSAWKLLDDGGSGNVKKKNNNAEQLHPSHKCVHGRRGELGFSTCFIVTGMEEDSVLDSLSEKARRRQLPIE